MADKNSTSTGRGELAPARPEKVMQVERHDYPDLAPQGGKRTQPMRGFDAIYTDIVDYIVRCTHLIWDERDIGLIYSHYTHNCVLYGTTGTLYTREEVVRDTIQRLVSFPERRGMATHVIWKGNEDDGFYTSHLVTGTGRHTPERPPRRADRAHVHLAHRRRLHDLREQDLPRMGRGRHHRDPAATGGRRAGLCRAHRQSRLRQGHGFAGYRRKPPHDRPVPARGRGRPLPRRDRSGARTRCAGCTTSSTARCWAQITEVYAPTAQYHGPLMAELYGHAAIIHQTLGLIGSLPDAAFTAAAHLLDPLRGGRRKGRRALDHGRPPHRLWHPEPPWRADRQAGADHGHHAISTTRTARSSTNGASMTKPRPWCRSSWPRWPTSRRPA